MRITAADVQTARDSDEKMIAVENARNELMRSAESTIAELASLSKDIPVKLHTPENVPVRPGKQTNKTSKEANRRSPISGVRFASLLNRVISSGRFPSVLHKGIVNGAHGRFKVFQIHAYNDIHFTGTLIDHADI